MLAIRSESTFRLMKFLPSGIPLRSMGVEGGQSARALVVAVPVITVNPVPIAHMRYPNPFCGRTPRPPETMPGAKARHHKGREFWHGSAHCVILKQQISALARLERAANQE
ncbi:hypothetical protein GCM10022380_31500 [Amycolatopsis tucumanensis]|uniref:Uncharacterized protein n=1 Tax=Amycolatopsis tucumanensis TaxID=401106 RepID=A0ABP7I625_9PSEU